MRGKRGSCSCIVFLNKNQARAAEKPAAGTLLVLVSILSKLLLAFVGRNLPQFAFSSAGHYRLLRLTAITKKHYPRQACEFKY